MVLSAIGLGTFECVGRVRLTAHPSKPMDGVCCSLCRIDSCLSTLCAAVFCGAWFGIIVEAPFMHPCLVHLQAPHMPESVLKAECKSPWLRSRAALAALKAARAFCVLLYSVAPGLA